MDRLECSAVQATKLQYLQLDQNNYHQLELLLGQSILGNFSTNQMVIELTTAQNYRRTQTKHRKAKKEHGWTKLDRVKMDCFWVNLFEKR